MHSFKIMRYVHMLLLLSVNIITNISPCDGDLLSFPLEILDSCEDFEKSGWHFPAKEWDMVCFNNAKDLERNETTGYNAKYNNMIPSDFKWTSFTTDGIWGFFHQDPPPIIDAPTPVITSASYNVAHYSLTLWYYMYGNINDSISVASNSFKKEIKNDCGTTCELKFQNKTFNFTDCKDSIECDKLGAFGVQISFDTEPGRSFILIDKIVAERSGLYHVMASNHKSIPIRVTQTTIDASVLALASVATNTSNTISNMYFLFGLPLWTSTVTVTFLIAILISQVNNIY